jgi:hypothetical protein
VAGGGSVIPGPRDAVGEVVVELVVFVAVGRPQCRSMSRTTVRMQWKTRNQTVMGHEMIGFEIE